MAKVVITERNATSAGRNNAKGFKIGAKRIGDKKVGSGHLLTLDADSRTFADDLTFAFARNVAKARRENKRLTGVLDFAPAKR